MDIILKVLLLFSLFKNSFQIQCTRYQEKNIHQAFINRISREVNVSKEKFNAPLLANYENISNGFQVMSADLTAYENGMKNTDAKLTIRQLVQKYGYRFEEHTVRTEDGYILKLHRVPGNGRAVFIQHGLYGSSVDWFMNGKDSLPFLLSDQGYDVWLGNARGNQYSKKHASLSPDCVEFWDFSFHEVGYYDLPASIDYVAQYTGKGTLSFIGYSTGTTAFFVMASLKPQYNNIVSSMVAIAPMAWMKNSMSPILKTVMFSEYMEDMTKDFIGHYEFKPKSAFTDALAKVLCANNAVSKTTCNYLPFLITGFDPTLLNMANLYTIINHYPGGGSSKEIYHLAQESMTGRFRGHDGDMSTNIDKYGFVNPPNYPVNKISTKVSLIFSDQDWLANVTDIMTLIKALPNVKRLIQVSGLDHLSLIWGTNVKSLIFDRVVALVNQYSN